MVGAAGFEPTTALKINASTIPDLGFACVEVAGADAPMTRLAAMGPFPSSFAPEHGGCQGHDRTSRPTPSGPIRTCVGLR